MWHICQSRNHCQTPLAYFCGCLLVKFLLIFTLFAPNVNAQIAYQGHLSETRIKELHNLAIRLNHSINSEKYACDSYYDYVCSRNRPLFSVLGHLPETNDLIQLLTELQEDPQQFESKQKLMDFFISCNVLKSLQDCYHESFEYFRPLFGYIIAKNHIEHSHEHTTFLNLLKRFLEKAEHTENFNRHPLHAKLAAYREKFRTPNIYFRAGDLDREYRALRIYRESYEHNLRNLEQHRKRNSTYELGVQRTMLDWSLYLYQSRNKPMSYYYPTLNVHLWMILYNTTERYRDYKYFEDRSMCLKLPQFVNVLHEARLLAVIYVKSFRNAWEEYSDWIQSSKVNQDIYNHENEILRHYHTENKNLFFTFYAQNFCDFGKELAENVFFLGLQQNPDFFRVYSCGYQTPQTSSCV